jgi:hypothetical protein
MVRLQFRVKQVLLAIIQVLRTTIAPARRLISLVGSVRVSVSPARRLPRSDAPFLVKQNARVSLMVSEDAHRAGPTSLSTMLRRLADPKFVAGQRLIRHDISFISMEVRVNGSPRPVYSIHHSSLRCARLDLGRPARQDKGDDFEIRIGVERLAIVHQS